MPTSTHSTDANNESSHSYISTAWKVDYDKRERNVSWAHLFGYETNLQGSPDDFPH